MLDMRQEMYEACCSFLIDYKMCFFNLKSHI